MKWIIGIALLIVGAYVAYTVSYPTYVYRYRVTIDVQTTDVVRTGSSVVEVRTITYPNWLPVEVKCRTEVFGEAVFVDLGGGRNLVALLALGEGTYDDTAPQFFAPRSFYKYDGNPSCLQWAQEMPKMKGRRVYAGDKHPTLITISDLTNPASAQEVPFHNPGSVLINVKSIESWIEITDDAVTNTLERRIPWIASPPSAQIVFQIVRRGRPGSSASPRQLFKRMGNL